MRCFCAAAALVLSVAIAQGEPYWIAWEGDELPEVQGPWERYWGDWEGLYHGEGAHRTLEDGVLAYDSLYDPGVFDGSLTYRPGQLDPEAGELFVMEWRLQVEQVVGYFDPDIALRSDGAWGLGLSYAYDHMWSIFEDVTIPFAAGVFHDYRVVSPDMRSYDVYIDGKLARSGVLVHLSVQSYVAWGDGWQGSASLHRWDYFRFGVVPEPAAIWLLGLTARCVRRRA